MPRAGADRRGHRLGADRRPLRRARPAAADADRAAQPRGGGRQGARTRGRARAGRHADRRSGAAGLSPAARRAWRPARPAGAPRRGAAGVRAGGGADPQRRRARVPAAPRRRRCRHPSRASRSARPPRSSSAGPNWTPRRSARTARPCAGCAWPWATGCRWRRWRPTDVAAVFATAWGSAAPATWNRHRAAVRSFGAWASLDLASDSGPPDRVARPRGRAHPGGGRDGAEPPGSPAARTGPVAAGARVGGPGDAWCCR